MAVKYYLVGKGVDADQITAVPQEFVAKEKMGNETYRRVEIRIYTKP
jgi:hypothetical protein